MPPKATPSNTTSGTSNTKPSSPPGSVATTASPLNPTIVLPGHAGAATAATATTAAHGAKRGIAGPGGHNNAALDVTTSGGAASRRGLERGASNLGDSWNASVRAEEAAAM